MELISRFEWGARAPRSVQTVPISQRTGFMVHYSAGPASQTVRAIQDFHMDTRGWADIGYNFLVSSTTGNVYVGRGWNVIGAHCANHNTANIGVCVVGSDRPGVQDVSDAARRSVRFLYEEANRMAGRRLGLLGHRDRGSTTCPGDELYGWIRAGMPIEQEEDEMTQEEVTAAVVVGVHSALDQAATRATATGRQMGDDITTLLKPLAQELGALRQEVTELRARPPVAVTHEQLVTAFAAVLREGVS